MPPKPKPRTLLVPGTQATTLRDNDGNTVYNAVRVQVGLGRGDLQGRTPEEVRLLLSMEHEPGLLAPRRTTLEPDAEVRTGAVLRAPYVGLPVSDWFRYDWRADIRWNAKKLLRFLEDNPPSAPEARWNLIGHSQGGLVIIVASKLAGDPTAFARLVGRVVLTGVPMAGTHRATEAILFGREDLGDDNREALTAAARTWPALYQMLPAWQSVVGQNNRPLPDDKQLLGPNGWPGLLDVDRGIQSDLLQRARETQALLRGPFSHLVPAVDTLVQLGKRQMTYVGLVRRGDRFERTFKMQAGDSLVPAATTEAAIGPPVHDRRVVYASSTKVQPHAFLCIDELVQKHIKELFKQPLPPVPGG